ncbi:hypothetical protein SAMN04487912_103546 [Arthrobacter sp. cf158]|nr:hypothetical protein SAMN04487912_103546 [Arthrobacter sp. cf158]
MRVGRFAEIEGISNPTATRLTGKLQQMRLVDRTRDDTDARSWKVRLTPMGERLMTEASGRAGQYLSAKFSSLPSKDQHALLEALPALVQLLETKA